MNDDEYPLLSTINAGYWSPPRTQDLIHTWDFIDIDTPRQDHRLYYRVHDEVPGFDFHAVTLLGGDYDYANGVTARDAPAHQVDAGSLTWGIATFDGVRHQYWTDYEVYPCTLGWIGVLQALRELELRYCPHLYS